MTYNPNIPIGSDLASQDIISMQQNFLVLNNSMAIDHYNYSPGTAETGMHKQVQFPNVPSIPTAPAVVGDGGAVYTKAVSGLTELFYKNSTVDLQLTPFIPFANNLIATPAGYQKLPGGLILQWGEITAPGVGTLPFVSQTQTVIFDIAFTTPFVAIPVVLSATGDFTNKTIKVEFQTLNATGFNMLLSSVNISQIYWFAIGI